MTEMLQDPAFYTDNGNVVVTAWEDDDNPFYVVCNGEMRINAINERGTGWIIRNTEQLNDFGIKTDKQLADWTKRGDLAPGIFDWINNSWFEIYSTVDPEFFSEPYSELKDAINGCIELFKQYPNGLPD